jgi:hypothetical protein
VEEPSADPSEREELEGDRDDGHDERSTVLRDEEGQRVQNAAEEGSAAGNRAAQVGITASGEVTRVGESFGKGHAKAGADRGREPGNEGVMGTVGGKRDGEDRRQRRQRTVDQTRIGE